MAEDRYPRRPNEASVLASKKVQDLAVLPAEDALPTEEELQTLRRVCDKIPVAIFLVAVAEVAERSAHRCLTGPMQNYIQNPIDDTLRPGALGLGQVRATGLGYFFQFWCYLTPIGGAIIADSWLGRFKTIFAGAVVATVGITILFVTSLPACLRAGVGLPGLVVALLVIGLGSGGIKSNVGALIADQYSSRQARLMTLKTGERVIVDPNITIQTIFSRYYWFINLGGCSSIAATWVELKVGFWATFLMSTCVSLCTVVVLALAWNQYSAHPPQGSIIPRAFRALWIGLKHGNMDKAKPSHLLQTGAQSDVPWSAHFVEELKVTLLACRVFAFFPIFWTCYGQLTGNIVSQAAKMNTYGLPNDISGSVNPITILVLLPLLDRFIYPGLRKMNVPFRPVTRITVGFVLMSGAIAFAAGTQSRLRTLFLPIYILSAGSEIFSFLSTMEFAYTKAPRTMKSLISSVNLLSCSVGMLLGFALSPTSAWSKVMVEFALLSGLMFLVTVVFYALFSRYNKEEEKMNRVERGTDSESSIKRIG